MSKVEVLANAGREAGSRASRRLRSEGVVPAVVYGVGSSPISISCNLRELRSAMSNRLVKGSILTLLVDGKPQLVKVQDLQVHPVRREVSHIDFMHLSAKEIVTSSVTLSAPTTLELLVPAVGVEGPASSIPAVFEITLDMADDEGHVLASALPLPRGVKVLASGDQVIAKIAGEE